MGFSGDYAWDMYSAMPRIKRYAGKRDHHGSHGCSVAGKRSHHGPHGCSLSHTSMSVNCPFPLALLLHSINSHDWYLAVPAGCGSHAYSHCGFQPPTNAMPGWGTHPPPPPPPPSPNPISHPRTMAWAIPATGVTPMGTHLPWPGQSLPL